MAGGGVSSDHCVPRVGAEGRWQVGLIKRLKDAKDCNPRSTTPI